MLTQQRSSRLLGAAFIACLASEAVSDPASRVFTTRDEAVRSLIKLNGNGVPVTIGMDPVPPSDPSTNCELGVLPSQLSNTTFTGPIGPNLSRHCDGPNNIISGSVLSAGIGSLGSTRTVSQPDLERDRQTFSERAAVEEAVVSPRAPTLNLMEDARLFSSVETFEMPDIALSLGGEAWVLFSEIGYRDVRADPTDFSAPYDAEGRALRLGAMNQVSEVTRLGVILDISWLSGSLRSGPDTVVNRAFNQTTPAVVPYRDVCGTDPVGDVDRSAVAGTIFADTRLRGGATLSYYASMEWQDEAYDTSACYTSQTESGAADFAEIFAGRLSAEKESRSVTAGVRLDRSFRFGRTTLTPNVGFAAKRTEIPAYAESERAVEGRSIFTTEVGGGIIPTGTALHFDKQTIHSAQLRIGFDGQVRAGPNSILMLDAAYVQEMGDGQQRTTARFVEDGRADPLTFGFLGAPVDRAYIEVGAGVATKIGQRTYLAVRGETLLSHDYIDDTKISVQMSMRF